MISATPFRIGIIGAGAVVEGLHLPVLEHVPDASVAWVCDKDGARAAAVAERFGVPRACDRLDGCPDADVVLVAVPVGFRGAILEHAFARRWHVFSEKPFAATVMDADAWLRGAASAGVEMGVGLMRRQHRATMLAARLVRERTFGDVVEVWAGEGGPMRATGRSEGWYQASKDAAGGGILIETGSHLIDQVFQILGVADAKLETYRHVSHDDIDDDARVTATVSTSQQSRIPVRFFLSRIAEVPNGIRIRFAQCTLALDGTAGSAVRLLDRNGRCSSQLEGEGGAREPYQPFYLEWVSFLEQCRTRVPGRMDAASARPSIDLVDRCYAYASSAHLEARGALH
jgi:predicted dehydrogenase